MGLRLITPPAVEPVSLEEVKAHLRIADDDSDTLLPIYIAAARQWIDGNDGWLGRALVSQTWELTLDEFPTSEIRLPLPPVQSVTSVKYDDGDGIEQAIDSADYYLDTTGGVGWVVPLANVSWPATLAGVNTVRVRFVAGYATAADVPAPIRAAILLMVGHLFANREAVMSGPNDIRQLPLGVDALLAPYRVFL